MKTSWLAMTLAIAVIGAEVTLGVSILLTLPRASRLLWVLSGILVVFTMALIRLAIDPNAPDCGCLGSKPAGARADPTMGLVRNGLLLAAAVYSAMSLPKGIGPEAVRGDTPHDQGSGSVAVPIEKPGPTRGTGRGFTMIELLVTISIIVLLIAITLPTLRSSRERAVQISRAAALRQMAISLDQYASTYETYPFFATRGEPYSPLRFGDTRVTTGRYFQMMSTYWASAIVPEFQPRSTVIETEGRRDSLLERYGSDDLVAAGATLSNTVFARPQFWRPGSPQEYELPSQLAPTRPSDLRFPSDKAMLLDSMYDTGGDYYDVWPRNITYGDTSVRTMTEEELGRVPFVKRFYGANSGPLNTTPNGVAGRDVPGDVENAFYAALGGNPSP